MLQDAKNTVNRACPNCQRPRAEWRTSEGYDGVYCCSSCAKGGPCVCSQTETATDVEDSPSISPRD